MASKTRLEELDLSQDELNRFGNALKDEKFRDMLCEYAQDISDPENRRRYEEEIAQMERERGMDITFVHPEPGYVLKTSVDGDKKAFINISKSDKIDKPYSERKQNDEGRSGLMWHIPHSFAPLREDHDKQKNRCQVYDFVVHPDTYRMAESNIRFKKLVEDTALDGVEKQFQVKLDRKNIKRPKMQFKGTPSATVIRTRNASTPQPGLDADSGVLKDMPYPYENKTTLEKMKDLEEKRTREQEKKNKGASGSMKLNQANGIKNDATIPKYTIVHRSEIDMQEYRNAPDAKPSTRPQELVIKIELPLLKSAAQANLDIFEKRLLLESSPPAMYKLDLTLPYPVDDNKGSAKFDKQKRTLAVTLPVISSDSPSLPFFSNAAAESERAANGISSYKEEKPLIEVLSGGTNYSQRDVESLQELEDQKENGDDVKSINTNDSINNVDGEIEKPFSAAVSYSLPDFSFTQDTETVSFVLKVKNVTENSIKQKSPSNHEVDFVCTSQGDGGFPLHFRLFLRFAENCKVVSEHCNVDVTTDNVVLLLLKERGSRGLWDQFWAGLHCNSLEKHLFLTTSNLQQQLNELDEGSARIQQAAMTPATVGESDDSLCDLLVTAMDEKKLTIKISPSGKNNSKKCQEEEDDEYDPPSSAEIEVVHSHPNPSLHSILKQHTASESSEDVSHDPDSPHSSNEEEEELSVSPGKRRSVSFSQHIDKATFKSSASVTSMKAALKSKRKRQRKWEEKKDKISSRRRHNSAGSEGSSDDHTQSTSDSHSVSEEEAVAEEEKKKDPDSQSETEASTQNGLDFRTKLHTGEPTGSGCCKDLKLSNETQNNKVEESNNGGSLNQVDGTSSDADDKSSVTVAHPLPRTKEGSSGEGDSTGSKMGDSIAGIIKSKLAENPAENHPEDSDDDNEDKGEQNEGTDGHDANRSGQQSGSAADKLHSDHRTECAFKFSNEVMFDLDVE